MAESNDIAVMTFELLNKIQGRGNAVQADLGDLSARMDRFDERLGRIERRLELTDA